MLKHRNVSVYSGVGQLVGGDSDGESGSSNGNSQELHQVRISAGIETETLTASNVVLASGSVPRTLPLPGFEYDAKSVINSDHLLSIKKAPQSAIIIGGGAIGR